MPLTASRGRKIALIVLVEHEGFTFYVMFGSETSPDDTIRIRASFDKACAAFRKGNPTR